MIENIIILGFILISITLLIFIRMKCYTDTFHEICYMELDKEKMLETNGKCKGLAGGDRYSNYLSYECIDCPYFNEEIWNRMEGKQ